MYIQGKESKNMSHNPKIGIVECFPVESIYLRVSILD